MNNEYTNGYLTTAPVNHLCLCSGYDGVGRGLRSVFPNLRTVAYVEREGFPIANLVAKGEENKMDAAPVFTDVKTFPYDEFRGCVDVLSAGFPCQPFSSSGKRQSTEDPRHIWPWIADGIVQCRPALVLLENVEGIISAKTGDGESVLRYVLRDLEERGYRPAWGIFSAAEVGAPHQRKRVFILAYSQSGGDIRRPREMVETDERQWKPEEHREENCAKPNKSGELAYSRLLRSTVIEEQATGIKQSSQRFPARPNERQYDWEEPRVTKTKSELGGATDGRPCRVNPVANRVNRLRLLGNGVVPATCERAVRTLWHKLFG